MRRQEQLGTHQHLVIWIAANHLKLVNDRAKKGCELQTSNALPRTLPGAAAEGLVTERTLLPAAASLVKLLGILKITGIFCRHIVT